MLEYYLNQLGYLNIPKFLRKYLKTPSLLRLKKVSYFCGMDYASKDIYNFKEYISRYDHSLSVALLTYKLTNDKTMTLAGLFHDIATPCFSHVIDYMNKDYEKQESTEKYTEKILKNDKYLIKCLEKDQINIEDIINFKKYSLVDNERPKLCADRIDGIILTGISWTKNVTQKDIKNIIDDIYVVINEDNEKEIGFKNYNLVKRIININTSIDYLCHSNEDNYMMELLAKITNYSINQCYITYEDLYTYNEEELFNILNNQKDNELQKLLNQFQNIKKEDIPIIKISNVKVRKINPLINNKRFSSLKN